MVVLPGGNQTKKPCLKKNLFIPMLSECCNEIILGVGVASVNPGWKRAIGRV